MKKSILKVKATLKQRKVIFNLCKAVNLFVHQSQGFDIVTSIPDVLEDYEQWEYLYVDNEGLSATHHLDSVAGNLVSYETFLALITSYNEPKTFTLKLNGSYKAEGNCENGTIKVGCQTFKIETIRQLVALYDKTSNRE